MKEFWSHRIRDMVPYTPGEQPKDRVFIKLNTNENPYPPSPKVMQAVRQLDEAALRLYPDPECSQLRETIATVNHVPVSQVFVGNGSDEVLAFCFQAFFDADQPVRFADITYSFYAVYVNYFGLTPQLIGLRDDFSLPVAEYTSGECGGIVIANPNAPTGRGVTLEEIRSVVAANRSRVVLVDEAYIDFGAQTAAGLLSEFDNLVVVRTLSKGQGLAGLRVGYALASENLISALRCVRDSINSYTVDRIAQVAATAAVADVDYLAQTSERIIATRTRTTQALRDLGFRVIDSQGNFVFVQHERCTAKQLLDALREEGILVRWFAQPRIENWLRISIGTEQEMDALVQVLSKVTKE